MFINDMAKYLTCPENLYLYADDSKLYYKINCLEDCILFQENLDNLSKWSSDWGMTFNPKKCCIMSFTNKKVIKYNYNFENTVLKRVQQVVDLGLS